MAVSALNRLRLQVKTAVTPFACRPVKKQSARKPCTITNTKHGYLQEGVWLSLRDSHTPTQAGSHDFDKLGVAKSLERLQPSFKFEFHL